MKKLLKTIPYIIIAVLVGVTAVYAGSLTPPGAPAKTMKSLADLYDLINTGSNTPSTDFDTPTSIIPTMFSLGDTYDLMKTKIADIETSKILIGTTIFGKSGSASPSSGYTFGDTNASKVLTTATGFGTYDASNLTDSLVKLGTTFGVSSTGTLVPSGGTAIASSVCNGLTFFGNNQTDWNLQTGGLNPSAGTILSGTTICGVPGTAVTNLTYGDASDPTKVLNTATNPGTFDPTTVSTYDVTNLSVGTVKSGTKFGDSLSLTGEYPSVTYPLPGNTEAGDAVDSSILSGLEAWTKAGALITGTMPTRTLSDANGIVSAGYYDATTLATVDADLISENILSGKTIFGVAGKPEVVDTTEATVPIADITVLSGKKGFVNGALVIGTMTDQAARSYTPSNVAQIITAGYYNGSGTVATDANLIASNIKSGTSIFGVPGNLSAGTNYSLPKTGQTGCWNEAGTSDPTCVAGTSVGQDGQLQKGFTGTRFTNHLDLTTIDNATGLVWQKRDDATTRTWANALAYCNALSLDGSGWRLPNRLELSTIVDLQIFSPAINVTFFPGTQYNYYWSSTTVATTTTNAWTVAFGYGLISSNGKTGPYYVRCVRG